MHGIIALILNRSACMRTVDKWHKLGACTTSEQAERVASNPFFVLVLECLVRACENKFNSSSSYCSMNVHDRHAAVPQGMQSTSAGMLVKDRYALG